MIKEVVLLLLSFFLCQEIVSETEQKIFTTHFIGKTIFLNVNQYTVAKYKGAESENVVTRKNNYRSKKTILFWFVLGVCCAVFIWEKWGRGKIKSLLSLNQSITPVEKSYREEIDELKKDKLEFEKEIESLTREYETLLEENIELGELIETYRSELNGLKKTNNKSDTNEFVNSEESLSQKQDAASIKTLEVKDDNKSSISIDTNMFDEDIADILYSEAIIDGVFHNVTTVANGDTVYEIKKTSNQIASFWISSKAHVRVLKNPDFIDGCDKQKIGVTPQTLEVENGEAMKNDFGKWQITKKAKVKFL